MDEKKALLDKKGDKVQEKDILLVQLLANDLARKDIATRFGITKRALDHRIDVLRGRFGVKTISPLVVLFYKNQLID